MSHNNLPSDPLYRRTRPALFHLPGQRTHSNAPQRRWNGYPFSL